VSFAKGKRCFFKGAWFEKGVVIDSTDAAVTTAACSERAPSSQQPTAQSPAVPLLVLSHTPIAPGSTSCCALPSCCSLSHCFSSHCHLSLPAAVASAPLSTTAYAASVSSVKPQPTVKVACATLKPAAACAVKGSNPKVPSAPDPLLFPLSQPRPRSLSRQGLSRRRRA
jgi:hypothetical protein